MICAACEHPHEHHAGWSLSEPGGRGCMACISRTGYGSVRGGSICPCNRCRCEECAKTAAAADA